MLPALLHEARGAGRVVVVTADHGHVSTAGRAARAAATGIAGVGPTGSLDEGEIAIDGGRVLAPVGRHGVVVPWSERVRYGAKKNGYHGGVSPQEMVVPVLVLAPSGMSYPVPADAVRSYPEWWQARAGQRRRSGLASRQASPAPRKAPVGQPDLLAAPGGRPARATGSLRCFASAGYKTQSDGCAGRPGGRRPAAAPRGARRTRRQALAGGTRGPPQARPRCGSTAFLSAARRVLNVDGVAVLVVDEASRHGRAEPARARGSVRARPPVGASMVSPQRRSEIIDALRRGTVPQSGWTPSPSASAASSPRSTRSWGRSRPGAAAFKAVRGEYGSGKTFFGRWLQERARKQRLRHQRGPDLRDRDAAASAGDGLPPGHRAARDRGRCAGAFRTIVDGWFFALEEDVLAEKTVDAGDEARAPRADRALLEQRLAAVSRVAPAYAATLAGVPTRRRGE